MENDVNLCPCGTQPLETERLLLRSFSFDDADSMMRNWAGDDQVQDMYGEPSNLPSKKVIDKCGFTYEGTLREYFFRNGKYEDRMYHSILRREWEKIINK